MEQLVDTVIDAVLGLRGNAAYIVIGLLAFGEAAAFIGLVSPGELAMVLGGVLASRARVDLVTMLAIAAGAAALGDSAGFWLGRTMGDRLRNWQPLRRRLGRQIERARTYFRERGGRAVVLGRWASFVKVFVPFVAGASKMTYPRFLLFSVPSAALWAVSFVLLGYAAGQSWHVVERYSGRASIVVLVVIALGFAARWVAKRAIEHQERIRAVVDRLLETPPLRWLRDRYGDQLRWLGRRFDPNVARGLGLTLAWAALVAAVLGAGVLLNDVRALRGLSQLDVPMRLAFSRVRTDESVAVARAILWPFSWPGVLVVGPLAAGWVGWRLGLRAALRTAVGVLGAAGIGWIVQAVVVERLVGTEFPSVPVAAAVALTVHLTALAGTHLDWAGAVRTAVVGTFVASVVSIAAFLTERAVLTGVVFAFALGVAWAAAIEVQARLPFRLLSEETARSSPWMPTPPR